MKPHPLNLPHSPLCLAILPGFVGLEILDLAESFAMHLLPHKVAFRFHATTAVLILITVGVCVYLLTTRSPSWFRWNGRHSADHRLGAGIEPMPMVSGVGSLSPSLPAEAPLKQKLSVLDEQFLALP